MVITSSSTSINTSINTSRERLSSLLGSILEGDGISVVASLSKESYFDPKRVLVYHPQGDTFEYGSLVLGESVQELANYVSAGLVPLSTVTGFDEGRSSWLGSSYKFAYSLEGLTIRFDPDPDKVVQGIEFLPAGSPVSGFYADSVDVLCRRVLGLSTPTIYHSDYVRHDYLRHAPYSCTRPGDPDSTRGFFFRFQSEAYRSICRLEYTFGEASR